MAFTENDLRELEQTVTALQEEFSRLNAQFDGMLTQAGLSPEDLKKSLEEKHSPELEKAVERARTEAARAGRARADQAEAAGAGWTGSVERPWPGALLI
jgi:ElaB/YqjD/DUF883 family membrane-anchored ribosome-binding protein